MEAGNPSTAAPQVPAPCAWLAAAHNSVPFTCASLNMTMKEGRQRAMTSKKSPSAATGVGVAWYGIVAVCAWSGLHSALARTTRRNRQKLDGGSTRKWAQRHASLPAALLDTDSQPLPHSARTGLSSGCRDDREQGRAHGKEGSVGQEAQALAQACCSCKHAGSQHAPACPLAHLHEREPVEGTLCPQGADPEEEV